MDACVHKRVHQAEGGYEEQGGGSVPGLNDVEQHGVCDALPHFVGVRTLELGDPNWIEVGDRAGVRACIGGTNGNEIDSLYE